MTNTVRTRFAPSPTGYLHVGGIRTALFAWLTARQHNGAFILRFEDTDKTREVPGARQHVIESLRAVGIDYDEGPDKSGPYGPYVQSERLDIYHEWAEKLLASGRAYVDPYTAEQVQAFREAAQASHQPFLFRNHRPEQKLKWDGQSPLRFMSQPKAYKWHDVVMGDLQSGPEVIDDFILIKSDGFPTYNFAHIIDDYEMKISHVMRGQEFLASVPNYLNLYEALAFTPPLLVTLPHILAPEGNRKLSKRDGATDVLDYIRLGYPPDALISFIATLGWNDGTEQEVFTRDELIQKFSLKRVQKSGAHFDERRLNWISGTYIRNMPLTDLSLQAASYWPEEAADASDEYKKRVLSLVQERLKYLSELAALSRFFFVDLPVDLDLIVKDKKLSKLGMPELKAMLTSARETLETTSFSVTELTAQLNQLLVSLSQKPAILFSLIRIAVTSAPSSPGLADTLAVLGKECSLRRIDAWLNNL